MKIEEIFKTEALSARALNICKDNGINDLASLLEYYRINKAFDKIRNCGRRTNEELTALCLKHIEYKNIDSLEIANKENPLNSIISNLSRNQSEIINSYIETNFKDLSKRSQNAITSFLNGDLKIGNVSKHILINENFNIQYIKNVGRKSSLELNYFFKLIKYFVEDISNIKDDAGLIALKNRLFIEKEISISDLPVTNKISLSNLVIETLESQSIFKLIDLLIDKHAVFKNKKKIVFQKSLKIYENQLELTIDDIAYQCNISREGVRNIRKSCLVELFNKLQAIKKINEDLFDKYGIDINQDILYIDTSLNQLINKTSKTSFSKEFNTYLIYVYTYDKFELVGNIEDVLQFNFVTFKNRHNWRNFYLVNKLMSNEFDYNAFANDINKRISEQNKFSYEFNFKSYLSTFLHNNNLDILSPALKMAERILNIEFEMYLDLEDNITFQRKSPIPAYKYAYEALKLIGRPSKVSDITKKINELHPFYDTNDSKVRASMKREHGFVPIGRKSVYGLKKWENELKNFKGGTIRSIVSEYLNGQLEPQHISVITSYVIQFRPKTNENSILQNLKLEEAGTFIFFKNALIGLAKKRYDKKYILITKCNAEVKKSWEERYGELSEFLNSEHRWPLATGYTVEERSLYRWFKNQVGKIENNSIEDYKYARIKEIYTKFANYEDSLKRAVSKIEEYNELKLFIKQKKRLPLAIYEDESRLYYYLEKQRTLYEQGKLEQNEEFNFLKFTKLFQTL